MKLTTMKPLVKTKLMLCLILAIGLVAPSFAQDAQIKDRDIYVPTTISPQAQLVLKSLIQKKPYTRTVPPLSDLDAWRKIYTAMEADMRVKSNKVVELTGVTVKETRLGGVPVLDIRPKGWKDNGKVLVYTHGGAYTFFSARTTLDSSAQMTVATGLRLISVDYTNAPFAQWEKIQGQVISVFKALLKAGYSMKDIALYGDSAGGGLATSTVLNLRDEGIGMPAAVVLWSPWADITNAGDIAHTLKYADPTLRYQNVLENSAKAYAGDLKLTDPRVSPLYADFSKGFSPSLIQAGTKEILLSTAVRLFQKLEAAGQDTKLDIYEGMWHIFQSSPIPEAEVARKKSAEFIRRHLK